MSKKKAAAHGKSRSTQKHSRHVNPEMDVLQERFNSLELDFSQLASMMGRQ